MGLRAVAAPIFHVEPIAWSAPDPAAFDSVLLTSANAARLAGPGLAAFAHLPCYTVGDATADAARLAGFAATRAGDADGAALLAQMASDGSARIFHPCGRDHGALSQSGIRIERRVVYTSHAGEALSAPALEALAVGTLVLLHSPRAASHFAWLLGHTDVAREDVRIAAISEAALAAAGSGWKSAFAAPLPSDRALLELAAGLCKNGDER